ncbi:hypothetical protein [Roseobacter litoralis]|uniref:hypothetical protein n=1 Tax=Roseobacter litoralis TaxID=42443 RepID=UPI0002D50DAE|nr:hypothetical protein [Roseobacter litoralis]
MHKQQDLPVFGLLQPEKKLCAANFCVILIIAHFAEKHGIAWRIVSEIEVEFSTLAGSYALLWKSIGYE